MAAIVPPPPPKRDRHLGKLALLALGGFLTAAGGAAWSGLSSWKFGVVTGADLDTKIAAAVDPLRSSVEALRKSNDEILTAVNVNNTRNTERVGLMIRERVGNTVAISVGIEPKRRAEAVRASTNARAKYDELMLRGMTAEEAEQRVYESAGVPR